MSLHHIANHLAKKGRHGDSTLVHMTKDEVAGLQALAKRNGTSLTINPHTGLPEAFSLKSLLPIAAGFLLGPAGIGLASSAMGAGLMVGGATALGTGSLKQGLIAGLGAYGGAGLGAGVGVGGAGGAGAGTAGAGTGAVATPVATPTALTGTELAPIPGTPVATTPFAPSPANAAPIQGSPINGLTETTAQASGPLNAYTSPLAVNTGSVTGSAMDAATAGAYGGPATPTAFEQIAANAQANPQLLAYAAAPTIAEELKPKPLPEIKGDTDMGQRYGFDPGYDNSIPGRTGAPSYYAMPDPKKYYGFADGGEIQYPAGESVIRMAEGGVADLAAAPAQAGLSGYGAYTPADANVAAYGLGTGIDYSGYDTMPNQGISAFAPQGNPNQNIVDLYKTVDAKQAADAKTAAAKKAEEEAKAAAVDNTGVFARGGAVPSYGFGGNVNINASGIPETGGGPIAELLRKMQGNQGGSEKPTAGYTYDPQNQQYTPKMAAGGISSLGGYSDGGRLLKGPGDGMSDNIPAQIGRKQPARLADGEFVVPADVVSHLGNGSTDAGAKQLYKMMDKIRAARTGRKSQGKQINPNKFMPA